MSLLNIINSALTRVDFDAVQTVKAKACHSFDDLINIYREDLVITQSFVDCLAICCAVHIAVRLESDPLWIYLVGPPSSGKSTICDLLSSDEHHTRALSKFTGLVSGSRQGQHLIPLLQNKCVIVKDGTLLLESTPQQLANVYGELRDIFDGSLEARYRNGVSASFSNISFGMIIGITERIYGMNMSALGERFLHCRLETDRENEIKRNNSAITSLLEGIKLNVAEGNDDGDARSFPKQRSVTAGFLNHLHSRLSNESIQLPKYKPEDIILIQALADVIACSRASVPRQRNEDIAYTSRPEASTRVAKQLTRLAVCLCYVYGVHGFTDTIRANLRKVALDTSFSKQHDLIKVVALSANGLNKSSVAVMAEMNIDTCTRRIEDMVSLGIFNKEKEAQRLGRGRRVHVVTCPQWIENSFRIAYNATKSSNVENNVSPFKRINPLPQPKGQPKFTKKDSNS